MTSGNSHYFSDSSDSLFVLPWRQATACRQGCARGLGNSLYYVVWLYSVQVVSNSFVSVKIWLTAIKPLPIDCIYECLKTHDMETLNVLQTLCEGNPPVTKHSYHKAPLMQIFIILFITSLQESWNKQSNCRWFEMSCLSYCVFLIISRWTRYAIVHDGRCWHDYKKRLMLKQTQPVSHTLTSCETPTAQPNKLRLRSNGDWSDGNINPCLGVSEENDKDDTLPFLLSNAHLNRLII